MSTGETENPLLEPFRLPAFSRIRAAHVEPAVHHLLAEARANVRSLLDSLPESFTWDNLAGPLQAIEARLDRIWAPVQHLHAVADSTALRAAYDACLGPLSEHATEMRQDRRRYDAYRNIASDPRFAHLSVAQRKVVQNHLRDARLAGVELSGDRQREFKRTAARLAQLGSQFDANVLDATQSWHQRISDESALAGLPESTCRHARERARLEGIEGWALGLDAPTYAAVLSHADNRDLRAEHYHAYTTRASERGPDAGRWDNSGTIEEIMALRHEQARRLDFESFAHLSLARKMAPSPDAVTEFLAQLATRSRPLAMRELTELENFARDQHGVDHLEAWDVAYYAEKLRAQRHCFTQEQLRAYFPLERVLAGMFEIARQLYRVDIVVQSDIDAWDGDVCFFRVTDSSGDSSPGPDCAGRLRGEFYLDPFARMGKRGGAWMGQCAPRHVSDGAGGADWGPWDQAINQTPVAYVTCNFERPAEGKPALLNHDEVTTLFHEFGHALQHLLTTVDEPGVAGINAVAWDAVELPSQFMENWCWERQGLALISSHVDSAEPLPTQLHEQLVAARNFHSGLHMVRQLEFALFDFRLHLEFDPREGANVQSMLESVRGTVAAVKTPAFNRFAHGFTHVFGAGASYAAGYYSYKWAEALAADAFEVFEHEGVFSANAGERFKRCILEPGGSRDAMDLYMEFRGRQPTLDALLRKSGLLTLAPS